MDNPERPNIRTGFFGCIRRHGAPVWSCPHRDHEDGTKARACAQEKLDHWREVGTPECQDDALHERQRKTRSEAQEAAAPKRKLKRDQKARRLEQLAQDTFCIYCQIDFDSNADLVDHIAKKHEGTYAYASSVEGKI
jgi:hypothetical protein